MEPFRLTNTQPRRITIGGQDVDPYKESKPFQVMKGGQVDQEATAKLIEGIKRSPPYKARWLVEGPVTPPPPAQIPKPTSLAGVEEAKALIWIKLEDQLSVLAGWAEGENRGEKRPAILNAIGTRAAAIGGPPKG